MKVLIPVSGGIDSGYLLAYAHYKRYDIIPVIFGNNLNSKESIAAKDICKYYHIEPIILDMPKLDQLTIKDFKVSSKEQGEAVRHIDYYSGWKVLMYSTTLAYGAAHNVDEIWWGISKWNNHFKDELKNSAILFRKTWKKLYPELKIPKFKFPIYKYDKTTVIAKCVEIGFPIEFSWSCFRDFIDEPCGECLGCIDRKDSIDDYVTNL